MTESVSIHPGPMPAVSTPTFSPVLSVSLGAVLISIPVAAIVALPTFNPEASIYFRVMSACGGALIGSVVPGLLNLHLPTLKAGGALGVFAVIFFLNPPQTVTDRIAERVDQASFNISTAYSASRPIAAPVPSIEKPASFPDHFTYTDPQSGRRGRFAYDAARAVFVEHTGFPGLPYYYFRPIRFENNVLWLYDDNRGFTLRLPATNGTCDLSGSGVDGEFTELYKVRVDKRR
jgi:hypothetical protein